VKGTADGAKRRLIAPAHDVFVAGLSLPLALGLRVGFHNISRYQDLVIYGVPALCLISAFVFHWFGMYRGVWRYFCLADLMKIIKGVLVASLSFFMLIVLVQRFENVPRSLPIIQFLCLGTLLVCPRVLRRAVEDGHLTVGGVVAARPPHDGPAAVPVLLIGCGEGANLLIRALNGRIENRSYFVVGIVDVSNDKVGRNVNDIPILASLEHLAATLADLTLKGKRPRRLVLTTRLGADQLSALQKTADRAQIPVSRLPNLTEFKAAAEKGKLDLRQINVEDLLRRPQVRVDEDAIDRLIAGRRVLVTGAGGSIGSELARQIAKKAPAELILVDNSEYNLYSIDKDIAVRCPGVRRSVAFLDIRQRSAVRRLFRECCPQFVFHAAALKHVPLMELNAREAVCTNVFGTRNVAEAARDSQAIAFIQVSTDKAVNPSCVMGATKRLAECFCQSLDLASQADWDPARGAGLRCITVRFGNVLGSSGSVVPLFQEQLAAGKALTVTHTGMTRYFMTIREAASLVLQAAACGSKRTEDRGLIYVLDMGEPVRILDIAEQVVRLSGLIPHKDVRIEIIGCRPGEKLHEQLFDPAEDPVPSGMPGINAARSKPMSSLELRSVFMRLQMACRGGDEAAVYDALAACFPSYHRTGAGRQQWGHASDARVDAVA
jgi:FlaA1/EpsC-like NDP-sugar epimerase